MKTGCSDTDSGKFWKLADYYNGPELSHIFHEILDNFQGEERSKSALILNLDIYFVTIYYMYLPNAAAPCAQALTTV